MANNPHHLRPALTSMDDFLLYYAESKKLAGEEVFCFQVGANDGKINDPVHAYFQNFGWSGLLLEPQCDVFHYGLSKTYQHNKKVILENVALAEKSGSMPFYRVAISRARWATGLSGFDLKSLQGHIDNGYIQRKAQEEGVIVPDDQSKLIEKVEVPTLKVDDLLSKHKISGFDVLCIDTEGYDFEILKLIDLKHYHPEVIFFESKNLSDEDFIQAKKKLTDLGYKLFWQKGDTLATKYKYPLYLRMKHFVHAFYQKL